jgi:release factor glutamine methyltransferase
MNRATDPHSIAGLLAQATQRLHGDTARLDAEVLLAHALNRPRSYLFAWPERTPSRAQQQHFDQLLAARRRGEPVAYLTGRREFWSLPLAVTPATLIPRPETETLVALALETIAPEADLEIADLGTGSGAIALALASERPRCRLVATDRCAAALEVARRNAMRLQLPDIEFLAGDWCNPLAGRRFDRIVSNPPYVAASDPHLGRGDVRFEPRAALSAGADGLDALRRIVREARAHLKEDGWLLLEHGHTQGTAVRKLLLEAGYASVAVHADPAGRERVATGRWR